jgi:two-component system, NtrC family, response regulator AtoC
VAIEQLSRKADVFRSLEQNPAHVIVIEPDDEEAFALVERIAQSWPEVGMVVLTVDDTLAARACRLGACEVAGPADTDALRTAIDRAALRARAAEETPPDSRLSDAPGDGILGSSTAIAQLRELIGRVSPSSATVLVRGETGTGKELCAKALHRQSRSAGGPFVAVHAAALPEELLESELFGYEKGAFTGANQRKVGRIELADGGTLFLDEVAEISPKVQAKLLRLLQEREFSRLGGTQTLRTNARIVAATHRDLEKLVERGEFREDLFYRLNVVTVWLPPLRARREDIGLLAVHLLDQLSKENGRVLRFDPEALELLKAQRWPGNVRQLLNFVERLAVLAAGQRIGEQDVRTELEGKGAFKTEPGPEIPSADASLAPVTLSPGSSVPLLRDQLARVERQALVHALERAKGNRTVAARLLGVGRRTLYTKLEEHGLL